MSYGQFRPTSFKILPPVVKNLLIINGLFFLASWTLESSFNIDLSQYLALHNPASQHFSPYQMVTYMFLHGGFGHLFFNMFALWMFGNALENTWGPKRFLTYYIVTGIGAAIVQLIVGYVRMAPLLDQVSQQQMNTIMNDGYNALANGQNFIDPILGKLNVLINTRTVGASGGVFGILLAFGMLFPNSVIYLYFAIPIKAKWFVIIYGAIELYSGIANNPTDNVAHFAHLGGMIFGFFLIKYWKKR
jgi:membrane associated rhomboid family serine protease